MPALSDLLAAPTNFLPFPWGDRGGGDSGVEAASDAAGEVVDEKGGRGGVDEVEGRVERGGKAHDDADAHHQRRVAAVDDHLVLARQLQCTLQHLRRARHGSGSVSAEDAAQKACIRAFCLLHHEGA